MTLRSRIAELGLWPPLLFVALLDAPWLDPRVVPVHDTFYNFCNFQIYYSHFFLTGELVQWYPYGALGLPADYQQLISLSPMNYLVGAVGALLRVRDVLLLFKVSAIAEQMVFVLGTWLLARRLFASRATAIALGLAAGGTVVWYAQQWFELRFFYLLPLLLYFFRSFLEAKRPEFFWLACLTAVAWTLGNVPYFVPMWGLVLAIVCTAPAVGYGRGWRDLFAPRRSNWLLLGGFLAMAGIYAYSALHSIEFLAMRDLGRDPVTGLVDLETFRTWGGNAELGVVARSATSAWPQQLPWGAGADNSFYFGLLPLAGVAVALAARERASLFLGLVGAAAFLVWLSLGGVAATIAFHLPGMAQYRHVGLVYGLVKTLLIVAAGFGLERIWRWRLPSFSPRARGIAAAGLGIASIFVVGHFLAGLGGNLWAAAWTDHVLLRLWLYGALGVLSVAFTRSLQSGLLLALAFDLAIFQAALFVLHAPRLAPLEAARLDAFDVAPIEYQAQRMQQPLLTSNPRPREVLELAKHPASMEVYWVTYQMAGFDPCRSQFWNELSTYGVDLVTRLERKRAKDFDTIIGCGEPKLRLVAGPTLASDRRAAREAFVAAAQSAAPVRDVVRPGAGAVLPQGAVVPSDDAGTVQVTHFTPNELTAQVEIPAAPGAWLLYADAMYPGWHASIDGESAPIAEANLAFKAVWVPAGAHAVRFWFRRGLSFYATWAIALFGLVSALGCVALACVDPIRLRFSSASRPPARPPP